MSAPREGIHSVCVHKYMVMIHDTSMYWFIGLISPPPVVSESTCLPAVLTDRLGADKSMYIWYISSKYIQWDVQHPTWAIARNSCLCRLRFVIGWCFYSLCENSEKSTRVRKKITSLFRLVIFAFCVKVLINNITVRKNILTCKLIARKNRVQCVKAFRLYSV